MKPDVLIIGAGVAGLGPAWRLAQQGLSVLVVDAKHPGYGASGAAAGMLAPTAEVQFEEAALLALGQDSLARYPAFVADLEAASGLGVDYRTDGTLVLGMDRDDAEALERLLKYQSALGLDARWMSGDEARELEPALSPNVHSAVRCASDHQIDPRLLIRALEAAFLKAGGQLRCDAHVSELLVEQGRACGAALDSGERIEAPVVIIAAGAWTRRLGGLAPHKPPHIRPVLGQMLSVELGSPPMCRHVIRTPDAYLVPKGDGRLIIGATMEERGLDTRQRMGSLMDLMVGAWEAMPGLHEQPIIETWVGHRPISLSNLPQLGPDAHVPGLIWSVGHGRNGILLTPLTADRIATAALAALR
jgi:glycine oxidase